MQELRVIKGKNETKETPQADAFTVREYSDLVNKTFEAHLNGSGRILCVRGILGELKNGNNYPNYYTTLADSLDRKTVIETVIPKTMVRPEDKGAECVIRGFAAVKNVGGKTSVQITASSVEFFKESDDISSGAAEKNFLIEELLGISRSEARMIPEKINGLFVIHPRSGMVLKDFKEQLGNIGTAVTERPTVMTDPADIINAVKEAAAAHPGVVAIIRGGGPDISFAALSDQMVARAWAELKPFKISALGHTENRTLLDYISDVSLNVPADAGRFLSRHVEGAREKDRLLAEIKKQAQEIGSLKTQLSGTDRTAKTWTAPEGYRRGSSYESKDNDIVIIITGLIVAAIAIAVLIYMFR